MDFSFSSMEGGYYKYTGLNFNSNHMKMYLFRLYEYFLRLEAIDSIYFSDNGKAMLSKEYWKIGLRAPPNAIFVSNDRLFAISKNHVFVSDITSDLKFIFYAKTRLQEFDFITMLHCQCTF